MFLNRKISGLLPLERCLLSYICSGWPNLVLSSHALNCGKSTVIIKYIMCVMTTDAAKDGVATESLIITNASLAPGQALDVFVKQYSVLKFSQCFCAVLTTIQYDTATVSKTTELC